MGGRVRVVLASALLLLLSACLQNGAGGNTVAMIPGYHGSGQAARPLGYPAQADVITATLSDTSPTQMSITLSQSYAPAGKVSFLITNAGTMGHEMVVLQTDKPAGSFPITGFEGEPNRFNEDAKGLTNVGETGDPAMPPGTSKMLTIDMAPGHYAIVCNLNGHYAAGMHQDFWVTPAGATP
ncbi:MAG TPA: sulfocyanin-like copper-binding protein [Actinomycetota bacterium]|nr:sulfocyanin-like copper-binding protein [Actinomycetota bacterium]